jgi:hypothetical protein
LYVAVDYGYKGNGAVLAFEEDGILKILDEYACTNETTQTLFSINSWVFLLKYQAGFCAYIPQNSIADSIDSL